MTDVSNTIRQAEANYYVYCKKKVGCKVEGFYKGVYDDILNGTLVNNTEFTRVLTFIEEYKLNINHCENTGKIVVSRVGEIIIGECLEQTVYEFVATHCKEEL